MSQDLSASSSGSSRSVTRDDESVKELFKLKLAGPRLQQTIVSLRLHSVDLEALKTGKLSDDSLKEMNIPTGVRMKLLCLAKK